MKRRIVLLACTAAVAAMVLGGCGQTSGSSDQTKQEQNQTEASAPAETEEKSEGQLEDGTYLATFQTDSSMFHVNEACEDSVLTVENGEMTIHVTLVSKNIETLYVGTSEEAKADEENWLLPTEDEVTYSDGWKETVYGFDIPINALDEDFSMALIGTKGTWYDHTVSVTNVRPE